MRLVSTSGHPGALGPIFCSPSPSISHCPLGLVSWEKVPETPASAGVPRAEGGTHAGVVGRRELGALRTGTMKCAPWTGGTAGARLDAAPGVCARGTGLAQAWHSMCRSGRAQVALLCDLGRVPGAQAWHRPGTVCAAVARAWLALCRPWSPSLRVFGLECERSCRGVPCFAYVCRCQH